MASDLGKAYVQIVPSAKGIAGSISSVMNGEASKAGVTAGKSLASSMVSVVGKAAAALGIGSIIGQSITEGGKLEQSIGGIKTLFGNSFQEVANNAKQSFRTVGISANEYMQNVTSFSASLLQALGGDSSKVAKISDMAMQDMADNVNKMGSSMESVQMAYQGFAKQNYLMLDNLKLGYGGTRSEMERLLADAQKITGIKYDINNLADVYQAIHVIQNELGITGATALEASTTLQGSFAAMKASAKDFLGAIAIGGDVKTAIKNLIETTGTYVFKNLIPMVFRIITNLGQAILAGVPELIGYLNPAIDQLFNFLEANFPRMLQEGMQMAGNLITGFLNSIPELILAVGNFINSFLQFISQNLPLILEKGKELLLKLIEGIISVIPKIAETAIKIITDFINYLSQNLPQVIQKGTQILGSLITGIIQRLPEIGSTVLKIIGLIVSTIVQNLPNIISAGVKIVKSLINGVKSMFSSVLGAFGDLGNSIIQKIKSIDLFSAGKAIINSFLRGLEHAFESVKDFVGGIADWIREHKGPINYDKKLLIPAGRAIMEGLYGGLKEEFSSVQNLVSSMATDIADSFTGDNIQANLGISPNSYNLASANGYSNTDRLVNDRDIMITVVSELDGREISRATYKYDQEYIRKEEKFKNRRNGGI